jgi:uncharacterized protein (DUF1684 family)
MRNVILITLSLCIVACQAGPSPEQLAKEKLMKIQHQAEITEWRKDRINKLVARDGWLSLIGMHWLTKNASTRVGSGEANGTRIGVGPDKLGLLTIAADNNILFQPETGVSITINGKPASGKHSIQSDASGTPTVVGFSEGRGSFIVIERGGKLALRVRDSQSPTLIGFNGLDYFDIDRNYRIEAKFIPHDAGKTLDVINILGMVEPMMNPGRLEFFYNEQKYTLEAFDEGDHRLFIVFADLTSGHDSYPAGRFVYAEYPDNTGMTILDFNKAYNPPCAFNDYSTCPMPPDSNRLDLAIKAGEKKPRKL